ncbi:hypothetical protein POM88_012891 [Heracleum sosnowskyi]|uniref:Uncharacterized protein n=1 Tax=Heracleum sosnowskyi TaxID=360622 RepID=A0AAD8J154_9APIA|nr:hypothetical protein POM88_012891 [Heracleum sosnowskyi]
MSEDGAGKEVHVLVEKNTADYVIEILRLSERCLKQEIASYIQTLELVAETNYLLRLVNFLWQAGQQGYVHFWPEMKLGWRIRVGTIIGILGAALGSVGGIYYTPAYSNLL